MSNESNPIVELAKFCQKQFKASIITKVIDKDGPEHTPTITAEIVLPNGEKFHGAGRTAKLAIEYLNNKP